jgi:hypothetical protein
MRFCVMLKTTSWSGTHQGCRLYRALMTTPISRLLDAQTGLADLAAFKHQARDRLNEGFYIFGAFKVGLRPARHAQSLNLEVKGFIDNDRAKDWFIGRAFDLSSFQSFT